MGPDVAVFPLTFIISVSFSGQMSHLDRFLWDGNVAALRFTLLGLGREAGEAGEASSGKGRQEWIMSFPVWPP